ncbi:hypothetical protein BUALT_Bualt06G0041300 [Buddleja alternifolia]|uniref:Reverse transcriptase n=1 Tax=Buddleja alternifolia TaxID=168488 RepID=A0AAV6VYY2_9LAMI|nr:hypothetical protein BUALT_BualtUnG0046600 [Buddleja alternifolia]KAG8362727.1 hypothetical protein BUALT_BualtUnG0046700 [Buddleja alternifolia]KAG8380681.1 hypothetical protein BUALT_Bualt06G0041300 [Buddleja alternifolia]
MSLNVEKARNFLDIIQSLLMEYPTMKLIQELEKYRRVVYARAVKLERQYLSQRAKIAWLKEGDHCTSFFFKNLPVRQARAKIFKIDNAHGQDVDEPQQVKDDIIGLVLASEIKEVLFAFPDDKAPGLDGCTTAFFKKAWSIIVEVPKKANDFRPLACCNVLYKVILKILANRITDCLESVVDVLQIAFILGRKISDNILLSQELFNGYERKNGPN